MGKLKVFREYSIYEVRDTSRAVSVLILDKPTEQDLIDICVREQWGFKEINALKTFIKEYVTVTRKKSYYRDSWVEPNPMPKRPRGTKRCSYCSGCGFKMDDSTKG